MCEDKTGGPAFPHSKEMLVETKCMRCGWEDCAQLAAGMTWLDYAAIHGPKPPMEMFLEDACNTAGIQYMNPISEEEKQELSNKVEAKLRYDFAAAMLAEKRRR